MNLTFGLQRRSGANFHTDRRLTARFISDFTNATFSDEKRVVRRRSDVTINRFPLAITRGGRMAVHIVTFMLLSPAHGSQLNILATLFGSYGSVASRIAGWGACCSTGCRAQHAAYCLDLGYIHARMAANGGPVGVRDSGVGRRCYGLTTRPDGNGGERIHPAQAGRGST